MVDPRKVVTNPSTNWTRHSFTFLMWPMPLTLHQTSRHVLGGHFLEHGVVQFAVEFLYEHVCLVHAPGWTGQRALMAWLRPIDTLSLPFHRCPTSRPPLLLLPLPLLLTTQSPAVNRSVVLVHTWVHYIHGYHFSWKPDNVGEFG